MEQDLSQPLTLYPSFSALNEKVITCLRCPRLVQHRQETPVKKGCQADAYWRRPVPGFGDPKAALLILGLAPSAQGGNRTGRIFTGDGSALFLIRMLHAAGLANQPTSENREDGLKLIGCYLTAAVKCVPPDNKPTSMEFSNCSSYFENEFYLLKRVQAVLALGQLAFNAYKHFLVQNAHGTIFETFSHGARASIPGWPTLFGSYHPSPQNTNTGKLTEAMFLTLLKRIKNEIGL